MEFHQTRSHTIVSRDGRMPKDIYIYIYILEIQTRNQGRRFRKAECGSCRQVSLEIIIQTSYLYYNLLLLF